MISQWSKLDCVTLMLRYLSSNTVTDCFLCLFVCGKVGGGGGVIFYQMDGLFMV